MCSILLVLMSALEVQALLLGFTMELENGEVKDRGASLIDDRFSPPQEEVHSCRMWNFFLLGCWKQFCLPQHHF